VSTTPLDARVRVLSLYKVTVHIKGVKRMLDIKREWGGAIVQENKNPCTVTVYDTLAQFFSVHIAQCINCTFLK